VGAVLVSHLHGDHFDRVAQEMLPKNIPLFCQPGDEDRIVGKGFQTVTPVADSVTWQGIRITRVSGRHGSGAWAEQMGKVSGFVLRAEGEPTLYWCGDTIWYEDVAQTIAREQPDVIITHSSGAMFEANEPIVMDIAQTIEVCRAAPNAKVVAVHLESLDHGAVTRADLRARAEQAGITSQQLLIPMDGETLAL
jgi:L-ascorbate metabolism protein UlaG (beta-lactamase superfamily)